MSKPNIFSYATKELSQDAVICWLIACSDQDTDAELRQLGKSFLRSLFSKHSDSPGGGGEGIYNRLNQRR